MLVRAKTTFQSTYHGEIEKDTEFDIDGSLAAAWVAAGIVESVQVNKIYYNTKVVGTEPQVGDVPLASGPDKESLSSQAAPASPKKTRKNSKTKKQSS